ALVGLLAGGYYALRARPEEKAPGKQPRDEQEIMPPRPEVELGFGLKGKYSLAKKKLADAQRQKDPALASEALTIFQELEKDPAYAPDAHLGAARCLLVMGRIAEAKAEAQAVLDDPHSTDAHKAEAKKIQEVG